MKKNDLKSKPSREDFLVESLKKVADMIAKTFGSRCEVVLHDLRRGPEKSIVKIVNGHITRRTIGGSLTDQGLKNLKGSIPDDILINYLSMNKDNRPLKSSSVIFRNESQNPIAALCINFDVVDIVNFNAAIQDIFKISQDSGKEGPIETFQGDIISTMSEIANKIILQSGKAIPSMGRKDKIEIIRKLETQGFFLTKGAVKLVAGKMNVSKFTIYNYLDKIRFENQDSTR